jgi:hypothetical protein
MATIADQCACTDQNIFANIIYMAKVKLEFDRMVVVFTTTCAISAYQH